MNPPSCLIAGEEEDWEEGGGGGGGEGTGDGNTKETKSVGDEDDPVKEETGETTEEATEPEEVASPAKSESPKEDFRAPASGTESPPALPRLRVNPVLGQDPARQGDLSSDEREPTPKDEAPTTATREQLDYIASLPPAVQTAIASGRFFCLPTGGEGARSKLDPSESRPDPVPGYQCSPCGIRFSSPSTLQAHQTYYCSHRSRAEPPRPITAASGGESEEDAKSVSGEAAGEEANGEEPPVKVARQGKQYRCPHCSYSADKKVSLNRHMRMHTGSPLGSESTEGPSPSPQGTPAPSVDRYCQDCDIRFSSLKTFRAHKLHYCSTRHVIKSKAGSPPVSPVGSPGDSPSPSPLLALPTNPVLLVPYALFQGASLLTGAAVASLPPTDTACLLMPDGSLQPVSQALPLPLRAMAEKPKPASPPTQVLKQTVERNNKGERETSSPLDLTCKRAGGKGVVVLGEDEKENRRGSVGSGSGSHHGPVSGPVEEVVCAPSLPLATPSPSPSPKRARSDSSPSPSPKSPRVSPLAKSPHHPTHPPPNGLKPDAKKPDVSLQSLLLAAMTAHSQDYSRLPFPPELVPHLTAMYGARLGKPGLAPPLPLGLPPLPAGRPPTDLLPLLTPEIALRLAAASASELTPPPPQPPPQVLVKQGDSKCQECNIVFYKHENYIAHKKHYCSSRKVQETSSQDEKSDGSTVSTPPPVASPKERVSQSPAAPPPSPLPSTSKPTMIQYICAACGIKFTSYDNLTAHQTFYCTKRTSTEADKPRRCAKCKGAAGPDHQCPTSLSGGWKCPCCPLISPTASAAQKHMETHTGVKAFLCTICRYKGNTLRGMRTHIRMHFDKRPSEVNEEEYITCLIDENVNKSSDHRTTSEFTEPVTITEKPVNGDSVKVKEEDKVEERLADTNKKAADEDDEYIEVEDVTVKVEPSSVIVKSEDFIEDDSTSFSGSDQPDDLSVNNNRKAGPRYCKSCDISFNYLSTFIAHKKYYCTSHIGENIGSENGTPAPGRPTGTPVT